MNETTNVKVTDVLIGGRVYSLHGADPVHLQRVASLLNDKINEMKSSTGYRSFDPEYKALMLNLNLADEYFMVKDEADAVKLRNEELDKELYAARHELISTKLKLENALKQQELLEEKLEEWKNKYEALHTAGI